MSFNDFWKMSAWFECVVICSARWLGRPLHHLSTDLLATVRRQAVQNDRPRGGLIHQSLINTKAGKSLLPLSLLLLLPHGGPHIGVNGLSSGHGLDWISQDVDLGAVLSQVARLIQHTRQRLEAIRTTDPDVHPKQGPAEHQRVSPVVAIADV